MAYLLGGLGVLAMLFLIVPGLAFGATGLQAKLALVLYLLLGMRWLWWAVRRFTAVGERVAAVAGVVIGWFMAFSLLNMLNMMLFGF